MALMHDVGKIGIPDSILNKPGRLTPEEFENQITPESKFARMIDKLEANIQAKNYDENGAFNLDKESIKPVLDDPRIQGFIEKGDKTVPEFFARNDRSKYNDEFNEILDRVLEININELGKID